MLLFCLLEAEAHVSQARTCVPETMSFWYLLPLPPECPVYGYVYHLGLCCAVDQTQGFMHAGEFFSRWATSPVPSSFYFRKAQRRWELYSKSLKPCRFVIVFWDFLCSKWRIKRICTRRINVHFHLSAAINSISPSKDSRCAPTPCRHTCSRTQQWVPLNLFLPHSLPGGDHTASK